MISSLKKVTTVKAPFIFLIALVFTFMASFQDVQLFGLNLSGISWFLPMIIALFIIIKHHALMVFPIQIWIPWVVLLFIYLIISDSTLLDFRVSPLQRTAQLLSPLFVAAAASTYRPTTETLEHCVVMLRRFSYALFVVLTLGSLATILELQATSLAAQVMTCMLLSIFFITRYFLLQEKEDIFAFLLMTAMPVLAITRMVIAATLFAAPMTFAPLQARRRFSWLVAIIVIGLFIFYLPQVQEKMFLSGEGNISAAVIDNPDLETSGRAAMWETLFAEASESPWLGRGTGAGETAAYLISIVGYPHNDWLLTYFDHGLVGVLVFLFSNIYMLINCLNSARRARSSTLKFFFLASASMFIPFMAVMYTDNIMVYASFFGILQYTLIGLAHGALRLELETGRENRIYC